MTAARLVVAPMSRPDRVARRAPAWELAVV